MSAVYLVKWNELYADGCRGWTREQSEAFRFEERQAKRFSVFISAKEFAKQHASTFSENTRVVRLRRREAKP